MTNWQRRLRAAIAVFGVAFAVVVYMAVRSGKPPVPPGAAVTRVDRTAAAESTDGVVSQIKGTLEDYRVEYDRSLAYPDGRQRLMGARVVAVERGGRDFTLTGAEADVGGNQDRIDFRGGVELTSGDGLTASAPEATFTQSEGLLRASGASTFKDGRVTGSSVGMTYDKNRDVIWLLDQAVLDMAPDTPNDLPVHIVSGSAGLARRDHFARFEGGFTLTHGARTLGSDEAVSYLSEDQSKVQTLQMRGSAHAGGLGDEAGSLRAMTADELTLEFADDGRTLRGATLAENASIEVAGVSGKARRISGRWIDLRIADDGVTVTALIARDDVRLVLPAEGQQGGTSVSAATLAASGENGGGLTSATFLGGVEYRETPPGGGAARVARAESMELAVEPGFGSVDHARFEGKFSFEEDRVRAQAAEADYLVSDGMVLLGGLDAASGDRPRVTDGQASIEGSSVHLTLAGRKIVADGNVRTVLLPIPAAEGVAADASAPTRSSMLRDDQPVFAAAQALSYDGAARRATYTGAARLWQGDTAIQGDELSIDDSTGNLSARGQVRSTLMLEWEGEPGGQTELRPSVARADSLAYDEASRKATYLRNAQVSGPQGDLRAGRIEVILSESGKALGRAEAYTSVTLEDGDREATGSRLTYTERDGRYIMQGEPVRIVAQCRDISGRTLTFFKSADTIIVDGNQEIRTQTKGGAACGERKAP